MKKTMKKGFTLVEMMIVVAIIAVLAGVAIPQYNKYVKKSETTEALRFMKQIIDGEVVYNSTHNNYVPISNGSGADANQTAGMIQIGFEAPTQGDFRFYEAEVCDGTVPGIVVKASTTATFTPGTTVYMYYPSNMTGDSGMDASYYDGTTFIQDYVNEVDTASDHIPAC